jgi:ribosomal protein S16
MKFIDPQPFIFRPWHSCLTRCGSATRRIQRIIGADSPSPSWGESIALSVYDVKRKIERGRSNQKRAKLLKRRFVTCLTLCGSATRRIQRIIEADSWSPLQGESIALSVCDVKREIERGRSNQKRAKLVKRRFVTCLMLWSWAGRSN